MALGRAVTRRDHAGGGTIKQVLRNLKFNVIARLVRAMTIGEFQVAQNLL